MAEISGRIMIDSDLGVVAIEVPERALVGLLHDPNFTAQRGANGEIGVYQGVPVTLRRRKTKR